MYSVETVKRKYSFNVCKLGFLTPVNLQTFSHCSHLLTGSKCLQLNTVALQTQWSDNVLYETIKSYQSIQLDLNPILYALHLQNFLHDWPEHASWAINLNVASKKEPPQSSWNKIWR